MEPTPTQEKAMTIAIDSKNVKVEMPNSPAMPMSTKLAHVLSILVAGVIALAVSAVLADGSSVIRLKDPQYLPRATDASLISAGINYRLDELLGPTYGIGLHHDQSGHSWYSMSAGSTLKEIVQNLGVPVTAAAVPYVIATDDLKHPVPFLKCDALKMAGICAMTFGFIAEIVAVVMVIFHSLALAGLVPAKAAKILGSLIWLVLFAGFLVVVVLAVGIYNATWTCDNPVIPSIVISQHFDYNYGFGFAIIGCASALLIFSTLIHATTMSGNGKVSGMSIVKILITVLLGVVVAGAAGVATVGALEGLNAPAPVDPTINPCEGQKPKSAGIGDKYFSNVECMKENVVQVLEQAGGNVTRGYRGQLDAGNRVPITAEYADEGLCPVNVHWHLGAEHLSVGEYDERGRGPTGTHPSNNRRLASGSYGPSNNRRLASGSYNQTRLGYQCNHYRPDDSKFTTPYDWQHCVNMEVGQTYEIHWPHSAAGACGTPWQYQTPFYDGVFCRDGIITLAPLNTYQKIGVQSQVFTVVNDEEYYNGNLLAGAIVDVNSNKWQDVAKYTGSTTGTSRDNNICSRYTPITWQVDRKCHLISASSFDKLCQDMNAQSDDMSGDFYAHGARTLVSPHLTANNQQSRK
jgi:hypothetical protein